MRLLRLSSLFVSLSVALLLAACGGGRDDPPTSTASITAASDPNAPQSTGNTASDGFNWFNFRRQQMGIQIVARNPQVNTAAQGHSEYQKVNDTITHEQTPGKPGFTGVTVLDRLTVAGYQFTQGSYAYGEVISSTSDASGANAAEDLITAIYHRFVIFEPMFTEAGAGAASVASGSTYFTADFTANGLGKGLGLGNLAVYPYAGQQNLPVNFFSDYESPDPVPNKNEVGYPISVHADIVSSVTVQSFTLQPHGGVPVAVQMLTHAADPQTPASAAAIVPLNVLTGATTYDVQFIGSVDGVAVNRSWSFKTR